MQTASDKSLDTMIAVQLALLPVPSVTYPLVALPSSLDLITASLPAIVCTTALLTHGQMGLILIFTLAQTAVDQTTYYSDQFCNPKLQKVDYDIAWILYDSNDRASCWSSISTAFSSPLQLCEYPTDKHGMYCSWCTDTQKRPTNQSFDHTCDAWPGMSGSPMFGILSSSAWTFESATGTFTRYILSR